VRKIIIKRELSLANQTADFSLTHPSPFAQKVAGRHSPVDVNDLAIRLHGEAEDNKGVVGGVGDVRCACGCRSFHSPVVDGQGEGSEKRRKDGGWNK